MFSEKLEERYMPGRRKNSFFMDMPDRKKQTGSSKMPKALSGYSYYIQNDTGKLVREMM